MSIAQNTSTNKTTNTVRSNFPRELQERPQWVAWRYAERTKSSGETELTKVPVNPHTGGNASHSDPSTWGTLDQAAAQAGDGEGYVFSDEDEYLSHDGYVTVGIDIDDCVTDGRIDEAAIPIVDRLRSYTELSPSHKGLHIFIRANKETVYAAFPDGLYVNTDFHQLSIEIYSRQRFFTVTGLHVDGTPLGIEDRTVEIISLYREVQEYRAAQKTSQAPRGGRNEHISEPVNLDDEALLEKARNAKNGAAFEALWRGDTSAHHNDQSEADLALVNRLAFWTNGERHRIDRLFRRSGLMRDKWDKRHYADGRTYGEGTIDRALSDFTGGYTGQVTHVNGKSAVGATASTSTAGSETKERRKDPTTAEYIEALRTLEYSFAWNECDDTIEVNGERLHTGLSAQIRCGMRDLGFNKVEVMEDAYTAHAYQHRYHPMKRYLEGLKWDGENHIGKLCRYFKDAHPQIVYRAGHSASVFGAFLGRWLIGAVAKIYDGAQNPMLVLDGDQDLGKSHFVSYLAAPLPDLFLEDAIRPDDKEHNRHLASKWIWEVAELGSTTRRADREALKAFITKQDVTFRKPYERHPIVKPAMASFIGTVNNESGFLSDPTGNRRFLSVTLTAINWKYSTEVDVNQVWAQAYALYSRGESWKLTPEEKKMRDTLNRGYEMEDPYEGWILKHYDVDPMQNGDEWFVTTADIVAKLQSVGVTGSTKAIQMAVGATLKRLGLTQDPNARPRGWRGLKPKSDL